MSDLAISVENLSKSYLVGHNSAQAERYTALRDVLARDARNLARKTRDMFQGRAIVQGDEVEEFWALKDISFEIKQGDRVGIIGRNGAGKSTLLKILSRITEPTKGRIKINGRVASLLEVGTGFHPELSGRENIFLNGAILGMSRSEIQRKFEEIVAFAEVEQFLDTPVKRYSSGMYVRLAFAVAAHLEPEILIVDEVLAVGDAQFQKKCMGKMNEVGNDGRTVLFVSHNMAAINQLCSRSILLSGGRKELDADTSSVVAGYLNSGSESSGEITWNDPNRAPGNKNAKLHALRIVSQGEITSELPISEEFQIEVEFFNLINNSKNLCVNIYILDDAGTVVLSTANVPAANAVEDSWYSETHSDGLYKAICKIPGNFLNDRRYHLNVYIVSLGPISVHVKAEQIMAFNMFDTGEMREPGAGKDWHGLIRIRLPWQTSQLA